MVLYLRAILNWLGFLFNTAAPHIRSIIRQCIFRIRKLGIRAVQSGLRTFLSRLLAYYHQRASLKNSDAEPETAVFTAASTMHPVLTPVNGLSQTSSLQANQLQVQVNQHPAQGSCSSINSWSPSPMEWDPSKFKPLAPQLCQRYKGRVLVSDSKTTSIPAKKKDFSEKPVDGWETVVHPEGALYFYDATRHVFTDANLRSKKNKLLKVINHLAHQLLLKANDLIDDSTYLVLELREDACYYYFVQHDKRLLFWLQDFEDPIRIYEHVKGVKSDTHIKIALEAQYWAHCELYPNNAPIQPQIATELKHVLLHAHSGWLFPVSFRVIMNWDVFVDFLTSDTSVVPYDLSTLQSMLDLSNHLVEYVKPLTQSGDERVELPAHLMCVLARLMRLFARSKFLNFYGQVGARLNANQSVYEVEQSRQKGTLRLRLANAFLWGAPAAQYKFLQNTWIDNILNYPKWSKLISRLNSDWSNVTIFSTVMLAVNVGFLAVPGVISAAAVVIYLSAMCSVSSLVASMLLAVECRGWGTDSAKGAASFMARMIHTQADVEALAIMYSLPYAYLIWAMFCFVTALGISVFHSTNPATLVVVGLCWIAVTTLTLWPAWWGKFSITPWSRRGGQVKEIV
ncbi:uncharacterized protein BJ212DRAFT_1347329 [Suillus subaureus]|uniref:WW domain-containing protein n=1 Tax=Suillus subaureus TaxID=48587 RepID=A0A9P7EE59_9AGAM|nr:uncharacterized protein BJ212DRAFT_1347329 [Suillus subaureus]KAG1818739.1 hypothetical protein BJ212DRAFT_1347329 [Suillus subaureus]